MPSFGSFLGLDRKQTAGVAKERLQIVLALERTERSQLKSTCLEELQVELVKVVSKYANVQMRDIEVSVERKERLEVLAVKVELPENF
jgi:cell division topological specificity factor